MNQDDPKMRLPLRVKLELVDGRRLFFNNIDLQATPIGVFIIEKDKPDITRIFPWTNVKELEIPAKIMKRKILGAI